MVVARGNLRFEPFHDRAVQFHEGRAYVSRAALGGAERAARDVARHRRLVVSQRLAAPLAAEGQCQRAAGQLPDFPAGLEIDHAGDPLRGSSFAFHLRTGQQRIARGPGVRERIDLAGGERTGQLVRADVAADELVRRVALGDRDAAVEVPSRPRAFEACEPAFVDRIRLGDARPQADRAVANVEQLLGEAEALRVVGTGRGNVDLEGAVGDGGEDGHGRDLVRQAIGLVERLGEGNDVRRDPDGRTSQRGDLVRRWQVVDLRRRVVEAAAILVDGERGAAGRRQIGELPVGKVEVRGKAAAHRVVRAVLGSIAGRGERALASGQFADALVVQHAEEVVAVLLGIAMAEGQDFARPRGAAALRRPGVQCQLARLEIAASHEVDDARDGVASVQGRRAVLEDLDALDGGQRDRMQVDARAVVGERVVGQASSVEQHQRAAGPQPAQRRRGLARSRVVADAQRLGKAVGVGR